MVRYFVELGPVHNRVFIHNPPARPLGTVVELTEDAYNVIKDTHPSLWRLESGCIKAGKVKVRPRWQQDALTALVIFITGLVLGLLI